MINSRADKNVKAEAHGPQQKYIMDIINIIYAYIKN